MRRTQALNTPALLIDQNRSLPTDQCAEFTDQAPQRIRRGHVAFEQDQPPGVRLLDEMPFRRGETRTRKTDDERAHLRQRRPGAGPGSGPDPLGASGMNHDAIEARGPANARPPGILRMILSENRYPLFGIMRWRLRRRSVLLYDAAAAGRFEV